MNMLKTCGFFESRTVISIAKSLVSTRYRNPDESDTTVAGQLLEIMTAMTDSRVLPKEDIVVCVGSIQAALRSGRIVVKEEDLTQSLMEKAHRIEHGSQELLSSDNRQDNAPLDFADAETDSLVPILPNIADIRTNRHTDLLPRKVSDQFSSAAQYIRYTFLSFREDFIGPLCEGIRDYIKFVNLKKNNPHERRQRFRNQDVRLYENVYLSGTALSNDTDVNVVIQIDTSQIRNFSSRLVYGSLVCLSCDEFQSVVYAVVSDRDMDTLRREGVLSIHILDVQGPNNEEFQRQGHGSEEVGNEGFADSQYHPDRMRLAEERQRAVVSLLEGRSITMLESTAFYTAYVHSLQALRTLHGHLATRQSSLPFKKQLLQMSKGMSVPRYFEASSGQLSFECMKKYAPKQDSYVKQLVQIKGDLSRALEPPGTSHCSAYTENRSRMRLQDLVRDAQNQKLGGKDLVDRTRKIWGKAQEEVRLRHQKYCNKSIHAPGMWPSAADLSLDDSQYAALRLALTHEVALIQGPPGTGKTTLGIRIAELLLGNEHLWRKDEHGLLEQTPFLLLSYTNHALDQFLMELLRLPVLSREPCHHVIRVGSRSEEETLSEHNITKLRQARRMGMPDLRNEKRQLDEIRCSRRELEWQIQRYRDGVVHPDHLHREGAMPDCHHISLGKQIMDPMLQWLCLDREDFGQSLNKDRLLIHGVCLEVQVQEKRQKARHQSARQRKQGGRSTSGTAGFAEHSPEKAPDSRGDHADLEEGEIRDAGEMAGHEEGRVATVDSGELDKCQQEMDLELEHERRLDLSDISSDEDMEPDSTDGPVTLSRHEDFHHRLPPSDHEELEATQTMLICKVTTGCESARWVYPGEISLCSPSLQERIGHKIEEEVSSKDVMDEEEADSVRDVWHLDIAQRWRLYRLWLRRLLMPLHLQHLEDEDMFRAVSRRVEEVRHLTDLGIMKEARVVAMTTTGAARYAAVLKELGPRIILVEEAAQVTEAHLLSSLSPSCQHLIMIGDHQQLRPSYTNYSLTLRHGRHHIDISLFERLCRAQVPFQRLALQHRMRPEISSLLVPTIYSELKDHASVGTYPPVKGVKTSVFFLTHSQPEDTMAESKSKRNTHEAELLASLYVYLRLQGYSEKDITILAMYKDQVLLLRTLIKQAEKDARLPKPPVQPPVFPTEAIGRRGRMARPPVPKPTGARVMAVDNFQGEESRIILLSLVRSNPQGRIGYLREDNRVCVALSRAKEGLYVVGNCDMLSHASPHGWKPILEKAEKAGHLGKALPLYCSNHDHETPVSCPADIKGKCRNGGCSERCEYRRDCGHTCDETCHSPMLFHNGPCKKPCVRECPIGHACHGPCFEQPCPPCEEKCDKKCPFGHPCKKTCGRMCAPCKERCETTLSCGHRCQTWCGLPCMTKCLEQEKVTGVCGHEFQAACYMKTEGSASCTVPCDAILECGHPCPGKCGTCFAGRLHVACRQDCKRVLVCGHECQAKCTQNCPPCRKRCEAKCVHSQQSCNKQCGESCQQCKEPCKWRCRSRSCSNKYSCSKFCWEVCDRPRCDHPCTRKHKCKTCQKEYECRGLACETSRCPSACPQCNSEIFDTFLGFEDEPNARFYNMPDCRCVLEVSGLDHYMDTISSGSDHRKVGPVVCPKCSSPVRTALRYGNIIKKVQEDMEKVKNKLLATDALQLREKQGLLQVHVRNQGIWGIRWFFHGDNDTVRKWKDKAGKGINGARSLGQLTVYENQINFLKAVSHLREKLPVGRSSENREWSGKLKHHLHDMEVWITDRPSQVFSEQQLTQFQAELGRVDLAVNFCMADSRIDGGSRSEAEKVEMRETVQKSCQRLLSNPKVLSPEEEAEMRKSIDSLKGRCLSSLGISDAERVMIVKAMNFQKGHWYKCKNGHIYCITECGGATEESQCPECGEGVGGTQHRLRDDNAVATEMDGAKYGAWSEQANLANYQLE
ncbi:hypothetical protein ACOMHN_048839 [Nucella lapillus]